MTGTSRKNILVVALLALAAAIATAPALGAPPQDTTFSVVEQFEAQTGVFTSDGSVVCASGTTSNDAFASGFQSDRGLIFHVRKTITCDDGSGTFILLIQASLGFNGGFEATSGTWVVLSGTGRYSTLRGQGTVIGTEMESGVSDAYEGWLALR